MLGQESGARLSAVTDPRLRHLLWLEEQGEVDLNQLPPIRGMLPQLQVGTRERGAGAGGWGRSARRASSRRCR